MQMDPTQNVDSLNHFKTTGGNSAPLVGHFPDFLVVGPQRTGTTWVYENLKSHPDVFFSFPKELYFFDRVQAGSGSHSLHWENFSFSKYAGDPKNLLKELTKVAYFDGLRTGRSKASDLSWYLNFFADDSLNSLLEKVTHRKSAARPRTELVIGEATASYAVLEPSMIEDIVTLNPDIKIVLMLRDPIERAWSHAKKDLVRDALSDQQATDNDFYEFFGSNYQMQCGRYSENIANWVRALKPGNLYVGDHQRIKADAQQVALEITAHIGATPDQEYLLDTVAQAVNPTASNGVPKHFHRHLEQLFAEELRWIDDFRNTQSGQVFAI